ncbi:MAG TPA: SH3 domain-containing protein, partial [Dehalococcoidia bacterium]|nr:SH3 domain-containing protein [Dehalococcoidia bacterium]
IAAIAVILTTGGDGGDGSQSADSAPTTKSPTSAQAQPDGLDGLTGTATSTLNVRTGPSNRYSAIGSLRRGAEVRIVGQSDDSEWLQIEYPARSNLHGWVIAGSLEVQGDLAEVPVATPDTMPMAEIPTYEAAATLPPLATPDITVTPTSTPATTLPDLAVGGSLVSGSVLVVTVTNQGSGELAAAAIEVAVYDTAGAQQLDSTTLAVEALAAGASIDVKTGYVPFGGPDEVLVIVDPNGKISESDDTNNRLIVTFSSGSTPTATETPYH